MVDAGRDATSVRGSTQHSATRLAQEGSGSSEFRRHRGTHDLRPGGWGRQRQVTGKLGGSVPAEPNHDMLFERSHEMADGPDFDETTTESNDWDDDAATEQENISGDNEW